MPGALAWSFTAADGVTLALALVLAIIAALIGYRAWKESRIPPEERERIRRARLVATGKMGDATVVEVREQHVFYAYMVRGVEYTASQDVSLLLDRVPPDLSEVQTVAVRYDPRNPANSIVVAEQWSGLRLGTSPRHRA
jgi:Protein of unknown function (DUF3592)